MYNEKQKQLWLNRYYEGKMTASMTLGKVLVVYGPRQVGKTSLIAHELQDKSAKIFIGTGDDAQVRDILQSQNLSLIKTMFSGYDIIAIDEAQRINEIGFALKLLVDHLPQTKIIASGSSSFQLAQDIGEPLTGRHRILFLYPVSVLELGKQWGPMEAHAQLENFMLFGMYPEVLTAQNIKEKQEYLYHLRDSYLFKDILELEDIRNADKLFDLLHLLAFQIGHEVSLNELASSLGLAKQTVERYLDLFEKVFIIKKVRGFSRNLRKEVSKTHRYYFWDNGIRNSLIHNFNQISRRDDVGQLWENFLFQERIKRNQYLGVRSGLYFWRTYDQKEIDLVEERNGHLYAYEFQWGSRVKTKIKNKNLWLETYKNASYELINQENYFPFITAG